MTTPAKYPQPPVELAGAVEAFLYDCTPADGCGVCTALMRELEETKKAKEWSKAYEAAAEIRNHARHATQAGTES
ncbi:hypothetical protein ACIA78_27410 [Streptomyces xanthochromogenes]|uniref:hypothetical protein n=1 Tax=Streptomyces xanthochromogenes TaxID=67384 RepID=UPI00379EC18A